MKIFLTIPDFKSFKGFMNDLEEKHEKCGKYCIHLKRFYDMLGVFKEKAEENREKVVVHKRDISKLPKLFKTFGGI